MHICIRQILFSVILLVSIPQSLANELQRIQRDLDGDGKTEIITISTAPGAGLWRERFIIKVGTATYTDDDFFNNEDVDPYPTVNVVTIDFNTPQRQLLVMTPGSASCIYHLFAYSKKRLVKLLRFESGPSCRAPEPLGTGFVRTYSWQGFWYKKDHFSLRKDGEKLILKPNDIYDVGVPASTGKALNLQGAECATRTLAPGMFIRIELFESKKSRYRIVSTDGACGWIPANLVDDPNNDSVKELPWAG